jgi:uncharacterized phiE125 gp8 family phage protein
MADLTTLSAVKAWLKLTATTDDALLSGLVSSVSAWIQDYLNRTIASTSYSETYHGTGSDRIMLANYPVTAVASVTVNGQTVQPSTGYGVVGYAFDAGSIAYIGGCFPEGFANVSVSYTAGYAAVPADLAQACVELVAFRYRERDRIGQTGTGMGPEHTSYSMADMPAAVKTVLDQYRKVVPT